MVIAVLAVLFIFVTMAFAAIALLYPEWVGITGKVAKKIQEEQRGNVSVPPPPLDSDRP